MKIYIDGSSNGKYSFLIEETNIAKIFTKSNITNNQAEYLAVLEALKFTTGDIEIYSDSKLVVNQLNHEWHIKEDDLRNLAVKIWKLIGNRKVSFAWIPREQNKAGKLLG
jgi:ribonuclease HI